MESWKNLIKQRFYALDDLPTLNACERETTSSPEPLFRSLHYSGLTCLVAESAPKEKGSQLRK